MKGASLLWQIVEGNRGSDTVYECRHCGTTVQPGTNVCPMCESVSIAEYQID